MDGFAQVQKHIRYAFGDVALLTQALSHSSFANESPGRGQSNERLEFLGDAVLELCITEELYVRYPDANEGQLTTFRAMLVNEAVLAELSRKLRIDQALFLGRGEENQGGRQRQSLLSDAFEALLGAIFLDGGYFESRRWVREQFDGLWPRQVEIAMDKDHKTKLQELTQQHSRDRPTYFLEGSSGPEHERTFHVLLKLPTGEEFRDSGSSVKKAEQNAARQALSFFRHE
ncbi:ribonuclease III [Desulfonatronum thioautotrophicum]|uniref:ribonuclease III n=1 Tax=Desulfonatronum thioautotrophicum TaxID=617001 RepID=UPI0005EBDDDA|nr:ribonuclease III [Desulfonatronum thioautotrophicum]